MNLITGLARLLLRHRVRAIRRYEKEGEAIQRRTLERLVRKARYTQWGREHGYSGIHCYEDFVAKVPLGNYASHKPYIQKMMEGAEDVLWKGRVTRFATSSGTTSDAAKFIPVSKDGLRHSHLQGGRDVTATYLDQNRNSYVGRGYSMILSGRFESKYSTDKIKVGDVSAIMAEAAPSFYRRILHLVPSQEVTHLEDANAVYEAVSDQISKKDLVSFSGVPTWNILVLEMAVRKAGVPTAEALWPHMELFTFGGMSILPYLSKLKALFPSGGLRLMENYNASEGFFGIQTDLSDPAMTLMLDYGNFYEFVPMSCYGKPGAKAVPLWEIELGVEYAVLVSTESGLWRYDVEDVVRFTRRNPYRFEMVGRTHQNISIWGEDLSVQQAEKALERACRLCGAGVREFTVAPVFHPDGPTGHHQWLVEFDKVPDDMEGFAATLDRLVQEENLDYEDFRQRFEDNALEVVQARPGLFYDWLESKGKLGGQHKIPRLCSTRKYMDELLKGV